MNKKGFLFIFRFRRFYRIMRGKSVNGRRHGVYSKWPKKRLYAAKLAWLFAKKGSNYNL